jgi:predicted metal-dependent enzyme (double-stranded beta helix superfamily)
MSTILHSSRVQGFRQSSCPESALASLIFNLEQAVGDESPARTAAAVRDALMEATLRNQEFIPGRFQAPVSEGYGRRLVYMGADRRFSLLAMVWPAGYRTILHEHGGRWCVEGVYRGEMVSTSYQLDGMQDEVYHFSEKESAREVQGEAAALVPPFDYHVLSNPTDEVAVTLHVYEGELLCCNGFMPLEGGGYMKKVCRLGYSA